VHLGIYSLKLSPSILFKASISIFSNTFGIFFSYEIRSASWKKQES